MIFDKQHFFNTNDFNGRNGFTLIELLVVISIIGVLASMVLAGLDDVRGQARDAQRKSDLKQIANATQLYYNKNLNMMGSNSGCGSAGAGRGWFNHTYPGYTSMAQCLVDSGDISKIIIDPTGGVTSNSASGNAYMMYTCGDAQANPGTFVYAKLENEPQSSVATNKTCCSWCDTNFGMNYYIKI